MTDRAGDGARVYEFETWAEEWDVACTLELQDDGRFAYGEYWTCSLAATGGDVSGRWSREGDAIILRPEWREGATFLQLPVGEEVRAVDRGDVLECGSFKLTLRDETPPGPPPSAPPGIGAVPKRPL